MALPKGSLRSRSGSLVGLWEFPKQRSLEAAYTNSFNASQAVADRKRALEETKKYTDTGLVDALLPHALDAVRPVRQAQNAVKRARAELDKRRAKMRLPEPDKTDMVAELRRQEIRSYLRSLSQQDRDALFLGGGEAVDPDIAEAVLHAPPALSGVAASNLALMRERLLEAKYPGEMADIADTERAIETTERAAAVAAAEIVTELGIPPDVFAAHAEPVLREVDGEPPAPIPPAADSEAVLAQIASLSWDERSKLHSSMMDLNEADLQKGTKNDNASKSQANGRGP